MEMTPEDRAAQISKIYEEALPSSATDELARLIAAAIRAAENDALERVAVNERRLIDKLERIAVEFWLTNMEADARSIEKLLGEVSPESFVRIGKEVGRVQALRASKPKV
jgi:capsid protein